MRVIYTASSVVVIPDITRSGQPVTSAPF